MPNELRLALNQAVVDELDAALARIAHCVNQLNDTQVWHRPEHGLNAIGNLLLHLAGNVKQMITDRLRGTPDTRDRPAEFAARDSASKEELLAKITTVVTDAKTAFVEAGDQRFIERLRIMNSELSGMQAALRCIAHFRGHTQEIIHMTRRLLGEKYQFAGSK